ncbi:MAG: tRNA pseudouridine(55) synthase TruB [Selenomonadaceae bacterium]|nr:tRNA pseudouridine(55) synthase TruB [Selenomonadaceae bacterium]
MNDGFINFNKAAGMTSHDAVNFLRKIFQTKKIGHGGTLDPSAVGVLPIAVGRAAKFLEYLADCDKTYRAEILFGTQTDSGDLEGKIISQIENFSVPTLEELQNVAKNFLGEIEQTPSKFSAIKINGRKAYDLARKNIDFEIPKRLVKIYRFEILSVEKNFVTAEIDCSKGTYIRTLAEDFGKSLNLPATLKSLQRIRVGNFTLEKSVTLEDLKISPEKFLLPIEDCLTFEKFFLPAHRIKAFLNGLPTDVREENKIVKVYSDEKFLGVGKIFNGELRSEKLKITELSV